MHENQEIRNTPKTICLRHIVSFLLILFITGYYIYFFRIQANFREVVPGKVYRSAQPSSAHLRKWTKKYDIKTIINLRAKKPKDIEQEKQVADELGLKLIPIYLSGNRLVSCSELLDLIEALEVAETPVLLHCESGIDRAGTASALAAMAIGDIDYNIAKRQAYVPPGPWKRKDYSKVRADYIHDYAHISDTLKLYVDYCQSNNLEKNDWQQFIQWAIELPPIEDLDVEYKSNYSYFPFLNKNKRFLPVYKLLRQTYVEFMIQIMIVILLVLGIKSCVKTYKSK